MVSFRPTHLLIHYGEIGLKGKNQPSFRKQLQQNIERRLLVLGKKWSVEETRGFLLVEVSEEHSLDLDNILAELQQVFGIVWMAPVMALPLNQKAEQKKEQFFETISGPLISLARERQAEGLTFAVRVRRLDKSFPLVSNEIERKLGAMIIQHTNWQKVNLTRPDRIFECHLFKDRAFLFCDRFPGPGGLPVGSAGRVLTLLSGGIDSPVAAYLMAKRGCDVDFIHFTATMMQQNNALEYKISRLASYLSRFTQRSRLYLVPYIHFDMAVFGQNAEYELVLFRRFMLRTAERLAQQIGAQGLVTGDNLAQVASQTLPNLVSADRATSWPIFRPLLTFDKQEIIDLAKKIGTYETSIEPYKDCCAIISRHPKTRSRHENLLSLEETIFGDQYDTLIEKTLNDSVRLDFELGKLLSMDSVTRREDAEG